MIGRLVLDPVASLVTQIVNVPLLFLVRWLASTGIEVVAGFPEPGTPSEGLRQAGVPVASRDRAGAAGSPA